MKTITRKIGRICLVLFLIAGMVSFDASPVVQAAEPETGVDSTTEAGGAEAGNDTDKQSDDKKDKADQAGETVTEGESGDGEAEEEAAEQAADVKEENDSDQKQTEEQSSIEEKSVKASNTEVSDAKGASGNGWTLDDNGVFTLLTDVSRIEGKGFEWEPYESQIKEVVVAKGVTEIPRAAFSGDEGGAGNYKNLVKVTLSSTVKVVEIGAFSGTSNLAEINLNEGLERIGHNAFATIAISEIHFPSTLKKIDGDAFTGCNNLTSVVIPGNVEHIDSNAAFYGCSNLTSFIIEDGNLKELNFSSITGCPLKYIRIPKNVETINPYLNAEVWKGVCIIGYTGTAAEEFLKTDWGSRSGMSFHAIDGDEHSFGDWETIQQATCTETGLRKHTCTICQAERTEELPATGHTWNAGTVTQAATQKAEGVKTYTCTVCGATKTEAIEKLASTVKGDSDKSDTDSQISVKNAKSPKTGDNANVAALLFVMAVSAGAVSVVYRKKRAAR